MMIMKKLYGALMLSKAAAYLLPDENNVVTYSDMRVLDPRYNSRALFLDKFGII